MITIATLHQVVTGLDQHELEDWIERRWVRPDEGPDGYRFEDIDVARIRLIHTLRHDMHLDRHSLPVVLSLLDQLHDLRRAVRMKTNL